MMIRLFVDRLPLSLKQQVKAKGVEALAVRMTFDELSCASTTSLDDEQAKRKSSADAVSAHSLLFSSDSS
jgi:hypothetical protein